MKCARHKMSPAGFRDHMIAASLKPGLSPPTLWENLGFRDHMIAASLKPAPAEIIIAASGVFPRSYDRGLIEAPTAPRPAWSLSGFHDHMIAASLKLLQRH